MHSVFVPKNKVTYGNRVTMLAMHDVRFIYPHHRVSDAVIDFFTRNSIHALSQ